MKKLVYDVGIYDDTRVWSSEVGMERCYKSWITMLRNCYSSKHHLYRPTQKGSTICEEWKLYTNFKKWYDKNYRDCFELDRTIFKQDNKHYSPELCCYIPKELKKIIKSTGVKSQKTPPGVSENYNGTFTARISIDGETSCLGTYKTSKIAYDVYKKSKLNHISTTAKGYFNCDQISKEIYIALLDYDIEEVNK